MNNNKTKCLLRHLLMPLALACAAHDVQAQWRPMPEDTRKRNSEADIKRGQDNLDRLRNKPSPVPSPSFSTPPPAPTPANSAPALPPMSRDEIDKATRYDPDGAYARSLDRTRPTGSGREGSWSYQVLQQGGRFISSRISANGVDESGRLAATVVASCDFTRSGDRVPYIAVTIEHASLAQLRGRAPRAVVLDRVEANPNPYSMLLPMNRWSIAADRSVATDTTGLQQMIEHGRSRLYFDYTVDAGMSGRPNDVLRIDVDTTGWEAAYDKLAPCWTRTAFWRAQYDQVQAQLRSGGLAAAPPAALTTTGAAASASTVSRPVNYGSSTVEGDTERALRELRARQTAQTTPTRATAGSGADASTDAARALSELSRRQSNGAR